jgi:hypothetical protein
MDIDAQWELYLDNTYTVDELKTMDFLEVKMPQEWLIKWMNELT